MARKSPASQVFTSHAPLFFDHYLNVKAHAADNQANGLDLHETIAAASD
jgi:hypothetical protein